MPQVKAGKVKALAVTGAERSPQLPDTPSMSEAGYPAVDIHLWSGVFAPAGAPRRCRAKLEKAFTQSIADPGVSPKDQGHGGRSRRRPRPKRSSADRGRDRQIFRSGQSREPALRGIARALYSAHSAIFGGADCLAGCGGFHEGCMKIFAAALAAALLRGEPRSVTPRTPISIFRPGPAGNSSRRTRTISASSSPGSTAITKTKTIRR